MNATEKIEAESEPATEIETVEEPEIASRGSGPVPRRSGLPCHARLREPAPPAARAGRKDAP